MKLIAYLRVSTREQGNSGLGLAAQRLAITQWAQLQGHTIVVWIEDVASGSKLNRPGLQRAFGMLQAREAEGLIVAKLDRASRSVPDFGSLLERAKRQDWKFIAVDLGVDTSTSMGELIANVLMAVAQWERRVIGERTSDTLQVKKDTGHRLGRPSKAPPELRAKVNRWRARGWTWRKIADRLNADGVPTSQGGRCWRVNTVRGLVKTAELDAAAAKAARRAS